MPGIESFAPVQSRGRFRGLIVLALTHPSAARVKPWQVGSANYADRVWFSVSWPFRMAIKRSGNRQTAGALEFS